jgi:hypothetical protein
VHIHVSEQTAEVEECVQLRGARPGAMAAGQRLGQRPLDAGARHPPGQGRSHRHRAQRRRWWRCARPPRPNLGDGLFPLRDYIGHGGRFGIGSDSNVSVSPVEELRWLEYGQRLAARQRNIAATVEHPRSGESVLLRSVAGGRQALAQDGQEQDWLTLDDCAPALAGVAADDVHDRFVFAGNVPAGARCLRRRPARGARRPASAPRRDRRALPARACARCSPTAESARRREFAAAATTSLSTPAAVTSAPAPGRPGSAASRPAVRCARTPGSARQQAAELGGRRHRAHADAAASASTSPSTTRRSPRASAAAMRARQAASASASCAASGRASPGAARTAIPPAARRLQREAAFAREHQQLARQVGRPQVVERIRLGVAERRASRPRRRKSQPSCRRCSR